MAGCLHIQCVSEINGITVGECSMHKGRIRVYVNMGFYRRVFRGTLYSPFGRSIVQQLKRLWPSCVASSTHHPSPIVFLTIHGDSGGEAIVLRGDCIGHCEKKMFIWTCVFSEWLPRRSCLNLPIRSFVNGNIEIESTVSCILVLI